MIRSHHAEIRATEEGRNARVVGNTVMVKSDTEHDLTWLVRVSVVGSVPMFVCEADRPNHKGHGRLHGEPGMCPCKHAAKSAKSLESRGFLRWDAGVWHLTPLAELFTSTAHLLPADPFAGLPSA